MNHNYKEKKVTVKGTFDLVATVAIPEGIKQKMPAVVLIAGTGTSDRDGNMKKFQSNIYKELSEIFASQGFVTIRYDKRGVGESKGDFSNTGLLDLVEDVISNIKYLESLDFVDPNKIILCGHSEGTMIATLVSTRYNIAGMILLSGAGTSLKSALRYQNWLVFQEIQGMSGLKGMILRKLITEKNYMKNVNTLFKKCCETNKDTVRIMGKKMSAKWIREHNDLTDERIIDIIKNANIPILAITGDKDAQATYEDIRNIEKLELPHVTTQIIPGMDHILRKHEGALSVLNVRKQYASEFSKPLHDGLVKAIAEWVHKYY
ncbi:alpha/beta fold hydrolase [Mobilitalea sibirica]|uniref:Alpha/beta fold hydrolase n=1 Tax=Mobilitalea sibirica TaxID=1462919 RepID=A0A8J7H970_9FIRM|nr:alpha/beta fold hydrolase [Mobilitalea sibirica]MBH1941806.1 alpha/beta fold hydrolase [Mobilitalea sibirica]